MCIHKGNYDESRNEALSRKLSSSRSDRRRMKKEWQRQMKKDKKAELRKAKKGDK